jgi:predicted DNA binding CopG/RHH family protein
MAKTRYVQVRVNQNQFERIKNNASAKGYKTTAAYIRDLALEKNLVFERQFNEMYREVLAISGKIMQNKPGGHS